MALAHFEDLYCHLTSVDVKSNIRLDVKLLIKQHDACMEAWHRSFKQAISRYHFMRYGTHFCGILKICNVKCPAGA